MAHVAVLTSTNIARESAVFSGARAPDHSWALVDASQCRRCRSRRRQWSARKGAAAYHTLKAGTRRRNLPIDPALAKILRGMASRLAFTGPDDPVFASSSGKPVDAHNLFNRVLKPIGAKLGMPWLGWHAFRHTHQMLIRQEAMSPADQMAMLGIPTCG